LSFADRWRDFMTFERKSTAAIFQGMARNPITNGWPGQRNFELKRQSSLGAARKNSQFGFF